MRRSKLICQKFIFPLIVLGGILSFFYFTTQSPNTLRSPASFKKTLHFENDEFISKVQPILEKRCVVCHSCYEAPCLMHFTSYEGIQRGLTKHERFEIFSDSLPNRIRDAPLYIGENNSPRWDQPEWAKRDFSAIFQTLPSGKIDLKNSLFALAIKQGRLNTPDFNYHENIDPEVHTCAQNSKELKSIYYKNPLRGMPYALLALEDSDYNILNEWMLRGAPGPTLETKNIWDLPSNPETILLFEKFFNKDNPKAQLTARYIYEHSIFAHIHFKGTSEKEFYELIRASNSHGAPKEIVTEKANDLIKTPFVYRLRRVHDIIVRKNHVLWELDQNDLLEWKKLFHDTNWENEDNLQDYLSTLNNQDQKDPFKYFSPIPLNSRYIFMVNNAEMIMGEVIKSPSCSGKVATLAIKDHFWSFFLTPQMNEKYLKNKINSIPVDEKSVHQKMSLTFFRHHTNATVHKGLWGGTPQTFWLLDYKNYEDLYYNLVINYKPWANSAHQILTWKHMTANRQEAEKRFIDFLLSNDKGCKNCKNLAWSSWEKNFFPLNISNQLMLNNSLKFIQHQVSSIMEKSVNNELDKLNGRPRKTPDQERTSIEKWEDEILNLTHKKYFPFLQFFPELVYVKLTDSFENEKVYSLIINKTYKTNNSIVAGTIDQNLILVPEENQLIIIEGLIGNHPNLFINLKIDESSEFTESLKKIKTLQDWKTFRNQFAINRNSKDFWNVYDHFYSWQYKNSPLDSGAIDLNFYQMFD